MLEFLYNNWDTLMTLLNTLGLTILSSKIRR